MRNKIKSSLGRPPAIDLTKDDEPSTSTELILLMDTASFAEGVPTMASLTATSSSNDTCCDIAHSERVELETFLQQPPIVMEEPVSHPKSTVWKGLPFVREFRRFQSLVCAPSSPLFHDFSHFFKVLKRADDKWRFHRFAREDIPDPAKRPPFIEERINVYVRDNGNLPASNCFNVGMVEDVDFFVGESRLLQYCALRCLQLGDIALCKAIAKVRKEAFYPDYASNIDWETRSTPSLALSTSSRSSSTAAASCPPLSTAEGSNTSPETKELEEETLFNKEAISDEDSDEIESHGSKPRRPPHEPHGAADSKPVPTRQRWTSAKVRGNRDLTFYNPKKG